MLNSANTFAKIQNSLCSFFSHNDLSKDSSRLTSFISSENRQSKMKLNIPKWEKREIAALSSNCMTLLNFHLWLIFANDPKCFYYFGEYLVFVKNFYMNAFFRKKVFGKLSRQIHFSPPPNNQYFARSSEIIVTAFLKDLTISSNNLFVLILFFWIKAAHRSCQSKDLSRPTSTQLYPSPWGSGPTTKPCTTTHPRGKWRLKGEKRKRKTMIN